MANLIILSGIPGAGKSTFINKHNWGGPIIVLSTDLIRKQLTGDASNLSKDTEVWKYVYGALEHPHSDVTYIVDATNLVAKRRKSYLPYKKNFDNIKLYCLLVDLEVALERNEKRTRHVPEDVIISMHQSLLKNMDIDDLIQAGYDEVRFIANN